MCLPGTAEQVRAACDHHATPKPVIRRAILTAGGIAGLINLLPAPAAHAAETANRRGRLQDLTHTFSPRFPVGGPPAPTRSTIFTISHDGFYAQQWSFWEHTATHLDAPGHFIPGGRPVTAIDPSELMFLPAEVIDISQRAGQNPDATVEVADLRRHEARYGHIPDRAMVLMNSGWQRRVSNPDAFRNADPSGTYHFPGFSADAAEFLLEKRNITGGGSGHPQRRRRRGPWIPRAPPRPRRGSHRAGEPRPPRPHPTQRRPNLRRRHPVGGRLRRPVPRAGPLLSFAPGHTTTATAPPPGGALPSAGSPRTRSPEDATGPSHRVRARWGRRVRRRSSPRTRRPAPAVPPHVRCAPRQPPGRRTPPAPGSCRDRTRTTGR